MKSLRIYTRYPGSRDSAVGIETGYGLDGRGGRSSSPGRDEYFLHIVHTGSGVHPTSYSPEVKRPGRQAGPSSPTNVEVKNA
jgi:hypothetical protein